MCVSQWWNGYIPLQASKSDVALEAIAVNRMSCSISDYCANKMTLTMTISHVSHVFINTIATKLLLSPSECKSTTSRKADYFDLGSDFISIIPLWNLFCTVGNFPAWFYDLIHPESDLITKPKL